MPNSPMFSRRNLLIGAASAASLAAFSTPGMAKPSVALTPAQRRAEFQIYVKMYGPLPNERFPIPAVDLRLIDPAYLRRVGDYKTTEPVGTVIVDTAQRVLFYTMPEGKAIRYGVGIGRAGFEWSGRGVIQFKRQWPRWTPPADMIARQPKLLEQYSAANGGMAPGLDNPLGARALYIFKDGKDTLYRLHGTQDPETIGKAVSSGCVRLLNQDVIDLYNRVPDHTPILVT